MNKKSRLVVVAFALIANVVFTSCSGVPKNPIRINAESSSAGVIVHGCNTEGWIQNTNGYSVRIKQVRIGRGEITEWISVFGHGEKRLQKISRYNGFHIYTMDGIEVGWISPDENGKVKADSLVEAKR